MVSATISAEPPRQSAFRCREWPYSGHCGQYSPTDELGGSLGWNFAGSCDGSREPTSPNAGWLKALSDAGVCPSEFSAAAKAGYEAGNRVAVPAPESADRQIVYECKPFPFTAYCKAGDKFSPRAEFGDLAWNLVGACEGTSSPTASPVEYSGTMCKYSRCREEDVACACELVNCPSVPGQVSGCIGRKSVCFETDVDPYDADGRDYVSGDVVRVGLLRFKCRSWPYGLWCRNSEYAPKVESGGIWSDAWTKDGTCVHDISPS